MNKENITQIVNKYNNLFNQVFPDSNPVSTRNRAGSIQIEDSTDKNFMEMCEGCFHDEAKNFDLTTDVMISYDFMDDDLTEAETEVFLIIYDSFFRDLHRLGMNHPNIEDADGSGNGLYYGALVLRCA